MLKFWEFQLKLWLAKMLRYINIQYHSSIIGEFILGSFAGHLCLLDFRYRKERKRIDSRIEQGLGARYKEQESGVIAETKKQIDEYLTGTRKKFTIAILLVGTDFQKKVWHAIMQVPYGSTSTYLSLAKAINKPKAVRAVANANNANGIGLIIPCHRITGSDGRLVGYAGGLKTKKKLITLEQNNILNS